MQGGGGGAEANRQRHRVLPLEDSCLRKATMPIGRPLLIHCQNSACRRSSLATGVPFPEPTRRSIMVILALVGLLAILVFLCVASSISCYSGRRIL